jgi:hypothetical protein
MTPCPRRRPHGLVIGTAVVCAISGIAVLVTVVGVGSVAASLVDAFVIGDASYGAAGVSAYNAEERIPAVVHRTGDSGAGDQSAHDEKSGKRSFDRWTHEIFPFVGLTRASGARGAPWSITLARGETIRAGEGGGR